MAAARPRPHAPIVGAEPIVKLVMGLRESGPPSHAGVATVNGEPGLRFRDGDRLMAVMAIVTDGERILAVYAVVNPDKLPVRFNRVTIPAPSVI